MTRAEKQLMGGKAVVSARWPCPDLTAVTKVTKVGHSLWPSNLWSLSAFHTYSLSCILSFSDVVGGTAQGTRVEMSSLREVRLGVSRGRDWSQGPCLRLSIHLPSLSG